MPLRFGALLGAAALLFATVALLAAPDAQAARDQSAVVLDCGHTSKVCVAPVAPKLTQSRCPAAGTTPLRPHLTLRHTVGVTYSARTLGPYSPGQVVRISAAVDPGYVFSATSVLGWQRTSNTHELYRVVLDPAPTCVDTQPPTFTDDSCHDAAPTNAWYDIADTPGVVYYVNSLLTATGRYRAGDGSTVTVIAKPVTGVTLVGATSWTHTFSATPSCVGVVSPMAPQFAAAGCGTSGHYIVPAVTGVSYRVNGVATAPGTYRAAGGSTVTVVAVARPGHTLQGTTSWQHSFATPAHCGASGGSTGHGAQSAGSTTLSAAPAPGPVLADTGADPAALGVLGMALVGVGALVMRAGRRRSRPSRL
jgi:hypothetical protein